MQEEGIDEDVGDEDESENEKMLDENEKMQNADDIEDASSGLMMMTMTDTAGPQT